MPFSVQLHYRPTLYLLTFLELVQCVVLVLTWWASTLSALRLAIELLHVRARSTKDLRRFKRFEGITSPQFSLSPSTGRKNVLLLLWLVAPRMVASLMTTE